MTTIIGTGEVGALHSREELEEMQRLPLQRKIQITTARIIEWYQHYDGKVYVAFSGGKDSTVLLDIVRRIYPDVPAVFSDTGLEFPEVREFVKSCENVTIVRPEMNFRKVIEVYGYPVISKRVADTVEYGHKPGSFRWKELHGEIMRSNGTPSEFNCEKWCYLLDAPIQGFFSVLYCHEEAAYEEILQGNWSSTYYCNYGKREQISACHMVAYGM